jgi:hypothetical protein
MKCRLTEVGNGYFVPRPMPRFPWYDSAGVACYNESSGPDPAAITQESGHFPPGNGPACNREAVMAKVTKAEFQAAFLTELKQQDADTDVRKLLKDEQRRELAVALAWQYVTTPLLIRASREYVKLRQSLLKEAVPGVEAAIQFFSSVDDQPGIRADLNKALTALRQHTRKPALALPQKQLGRDRDWTAVRWIKKQLKIKHDVVAVIINAADSAYRTGQRPVDAENVSKALLRLDKRLPLTVLDLSATK